MNFSQISESLYNASKYITGSLGMVLGYIGTAATVSFVSRKITQQVLTSAVPVIGPALTLIGAGEAIGCMAGCFAGTQVANLTGQYAEKAFDKVLEKARCYQPFFEFTSAVSTVLTIEQNSELASTLTIASKPG